MNRIGSATLMPASAFKYLSTLSISLFNDDYKLEHADEYSRSDGKILDLSVFFMKVEVLFSNESLTVCTLLLFLFLLLIVTSEGYVKIN